jgi:hypothetical protein
MKQKCMRVAWKWTGWTQNTQLLLEDFGVFPIARSIAREDAGQFTASIIPPASFLKNDAGGIAPLPHPLH